MNSKNDQLVEGYNPVYLVFVSDDFFFFRFLNVFYSKNRLKSFLNVFYSKNRLKSQKNRKNIPKIRHMAR